MTAKVNEGCISCGACIAACPEVFRLFTMIYKSRKFSKNGEKNRMVFLDLDYWGHSVEIMRSVISYFSGWLDENDCDKEEAYFIEEQPDGVAPNIIKITRKELNRRLGGMVVIIDDEEKETAE